MTLSYSTNSIRTKFGDLSLESAQERLSPKEKSLLTKSLAQEDRGGMSISPQQHAKQTSILEGDAKLTDDHPEPELLATSVGKDIDGRLIPSSSTISLLSLNANGNLSSAATQYSGFPHFIDRKNSHGSGLVLRNSLTHLSHQRLHPYHKLTSLTSQNQEMACAHTQSIPLIRNAGSMLLTPDSPNLDPVSLGGSPSRFWLASQTPPKSLSGSYNKRSCTLQLSQLHSNPASTVPGTSSSGATSINTSRPPLRAFRGDDSPTLNPVQTPLEDLPMTPLYLNSEADLYFVYSNSGHGRDQLIKRDLFQYDEEESEEDAVNEGCEEVLQYNEQEEPQG